MKNKIFLTVILLFFTLSAFAQNVPAKSDLSTVIDTIGIFSKMTDTLNNLKYRLADEESFFGFYLTHRIEIPFTMQKNTDYIILISTCDQQSLKIKLANATDRITFASTESKKIYMKYHSPVKKDIFLTLESNTVIQPTVTVVMFFCRDKDSMALPFDDITSTLREISGSSECYNKKITSRLPFFIVGGTIKSHQQLQYTLPFDLHDNNPVFYRMPNHQLEKNELEDFHFILGKSKTVSDITAIVYRGNGIDFRKKSDTIIGFSHDFTKKGPYQLQGINSSPLAFEHGILFFAAFDK